MNSQIKAAFAVTALSLSLYSIQSTAAGHAMLPEAIMVPPGHSKSLSTVAQGTVAWMCKQSDKGPAWSFAGPAAVLSDDMGKPAISYYGPPATWEHMDGSKLTGKQLATAPSAAGSIPFQLVRTNDSPREGVLKDVTYIQRINLNGGAAPASGCDSASLGAKVLVAYTGEYIFWKAD